MPTETNPTPSLATPWLSSTTAAARIPPSEERPRTFAEMSARYGKSIGWWRRHADEGNFATVLWGGAKAIPASEVARIAAEGLPPLPRYVPKRGKTAKVA
jgi:hypothetical protein